MASAPSWDPHLPRLPLHILRLRTRPRRAACVVEEHGCPPSDASRRGAGKGEAAIRQDAADTEKTKDRVHGRSSDIPDALGSVTRFEQRKEASGAAACCVA